MRLVIETKHVWKLNPGTLKMKSGKLRICNIQADIGQISQRELNKMRRERGPKWKELCVCIAKEAMLRGFSVRLVTSYRALWIRLKMSSFYN